jgi:glycosyltransferase involved in cell wall biosynthesis
MHEQTPQQKNETLEALQAENQALKQQVAQQETALAASFAKYNAAAAQVSLLTREKAQAEQALAAVTNSFCWRATRPVRALLNGLRRVLEHTPRLLNLCRKAKRGLMKLRRLSLADLRRNAQLRRWGRAWRAKHGKLAVPADFGCTRAEYEAQCNATFPQRHTFSILVPLYNTPESFLREMIASVQHQTYGDWELCLADGSDDQHSEVGRICQELAQSDGRIRYRKLEENRGISGNTNACIELATGDYIGLFDHDDLLHPSALYEMMCAICAQEADFLYTDENTFQKNPRDAYCPHYKADFAPDTLRSYNYICHFTVFRRSLMEQVGTFRSAFDGSQDYDLILRLTEQAQRIVHIPKILYFWRASANSTAADISAKPYTMDAARRALAEHLVRLGLEGTVEDARIPSTYKINYAIQGQPLISILIPSCDHWTTLKRCIDSILARSTYRNFEIVVIENNSIDPATFAYYDQLEAQPEVRVVRWQDKFNYSAINNFGFAHAKGDYVLLLNNDIEVITPGWLEEMLMFAQRSDVGAVGAMLYYPSDKVQHGGVILGIGGVAGHAHKYFARGSYGYMSRLAIAQNLSAVTAACVMVPRHVYEETHGLNEDFEVAFNDIDFCMRIRKAGYLIVWTPFAELYHYESESRGTEDTPEKQARFESEVRRFWSLWQPELDRGDPYYNPNLTLEREDYSLRSEDKNR